MKVKSIKKFISLFSFLLWWALICLINIPVFASSVYTNISCNTKKYHTYRSKYDNSLQPYVVMSPCDSEIKEGLPLIVELRSDLKSDKVKFSQTTRYNPTSMVKVWPYSRGCSEYRGLSELDVLEVIELVCEEYKIDRERIYLDSDSFGAVGSWLIAGRYPDIFAAVIAKNNYNLKYVNNFFVLPIWQMWMKSKKPDYWLIYTIKKMKKLGANITFTDFREKENIKFMDSKKRTKWFSGKRKISQPDKVAYSTYGDVDGAYWIRNIMPDRFGKKASVLAEAKVLSNQYSVIGTKNVSSFSLDLRKEQFLKFKKWKIIIDNLIITNGLSGEMFSYTFLHPPKSPLMVRQAHQPGGLVKRNVFCGGIADVIYDSFLFAYCADDIKARMRAIQFNIAITNQFDGKFKVVPDTYLTSELCEKYNVILFASSEKPGKFLKENIENLPFEILDGKLEFNHANISTQAQQSLWTHTKHKRDACSTFACVYPNPIANNRYLLTITITNLMPKILITERNDFIINDQSGSFDINWDKIQWQNF